MKHKRRFALGNSKFAFGDARLALPNANLASPNENDPLFQAGRGKYKV